MALNFLQRLSGIATLARQFADRVAGTGCRVLDTRKTTPGLRRLEKLAAAAGGITNHRMGLYDAVLIKNNHIAAAGACGNAMERVRDDRPGSRGGSAHASRTGRSSGRRGYAVLLDNLTPGEAEAEVRWIAGRATSGTLGRDRSG